MSEIKEVVQEARSKIQAYLVAIAIFALLSINTLENLSYRAAWDDLLAWLTLKDFVSSLYKETPQHEKSFYTPPYCSDSDPLYRSKKPDGELGYTGCPVEGVLVAGPGLWRGHRLDKFFIDIVYPAETRLQVFLYPTPPSSFFFIKDDDPHQIHFSGIKFAIFDPLVVKFDIETELPETTPTGGLPFYNYLIARRDKPSDEYIILRKKPGYHYLIMDEKPGLRVDPDDDKPWWWWKLRPLLRAEGIDPNSAKITLSDPVLLAALKDAYTDPSEVDFAGLKLPARPFLQTFNILMAAMLFGAVSTIRALEVFSDEGQSSNSLWLFATPLGDGWKAVATEISIRAITFIIVGTPLLSLVTQTQMGLWSGAFTGWALATSNFLCMVFSTLLLWRLFMALQGLREASHR
ncbi:hypothetical protein AB4Z13_27305 [Rhizobium sp. YAF28]|uniref:hypothetical protein n=1 Tax=Rhizobium sp. YAF28 TaxID=3233081 RepID=UPI003F98D5DC